MGHYCAVRLCCGLRRTSDLLLPLVPNMPGSRFFLKIRRGTEGKARSSQQVIRHCIGTSESWQRVRRDFYLFSASYPVGIRSRHSARAVGLVSPEIDRFMAYR